MQYKSCKESWLKKLKTLLSFYTFLLSSDCIVVSMYKIKITKQRLFICTAVTIRWQRFKRTIRLQNSRTKKTVYFMCYKYIRYFIGDVKKKRFCDYTACSDNIMDDTTYDRRNMILTCNLINVHIYIQRIIFTNACLQGISKIIINRIISFKTMCCVYNLFCLWF